LLASRRFGHLIEAFPSRSVDSLVSGQALPTSYRDIDIDRLDFDSMADSPYSFSGK
jgi:hypothetical protein